MLLLPEDKRKSGVLNKLLGPAFFLLQGFISGAEIGLFTLYLWQERFGIALTLLASTFLQYNAIVSVAGRDSKRILLFFFLNFLPAAFLVYLYFFYQVKEHPKSGTFDFFKFKSMIFDVILAQIVSQAMMLHSYRQISFHENSMVKNDTQMVMTMNMERRSSSQNLKSQVVIGFVLSVLLWHSMWQPYHVLTAVLLLSGILQTGMLFTKRLPVLFLLSVDLPVIAFCAHVLQLPGFVLLQETPFMGIALVVITMRMFVILLILLEEEEDELVKTFSPENC